MKDLFISGWKMNRHVNPMLITILKTSNCIFWKRKFHSPACAWPHAGHHMPKEDTKRIEAHWRDLVLKSDKDSDIVAKKKYILSMFPYPSGNLHMGHVRVYTISDCMARYYALLGYKVIHPMGWDAFGLPAENAAIEKKQNPASWTLSNIETMRQQLLQLGCKFDWEREISTCDPSYYRWTQLIFMKLHEAGLAYQRESYVNWDPVDRTVLAQEQINEEGRSWRSGAIVEKRPLRQWFVRATRFTKDLVDGLDQMSHWGDIAEIQRNWLGDCDVYKFWLPLQNSDGTRHSDDIDLLLKDPSQLSRADFLVIKSSHILNQQQHLAIYRQSGKLSLMATNPLNGYQLPIIVSDSGDFCGEAADARLGFFNDPNDNRLLERCQVTEGQRSMVSMSTEETVSHAKKNGWGGFVTSSRLSDWVVSRQRYWGTPIPIIHCTKCRAVPVPEADLPVLLPSDFPSSVSADHRSPLASSTEWTRVTCPKCGGEAERETDTLDTFFDSSWYYLRYLDPKNTTEPFDKKKVEELAPVDLYIGGKEHATLHLYYARVVSHFLHSLGWNPSKEPFHRLLPQGMVMGKAYQIESTGQYLPKERVIAKEDGQLVDSSSGLTVMETWEKMSKSKYNGVNPEDVLNTYGTDMTRLLVTSVAAPKAHRNWDLSAHKGLQRWLERIKWNVNTFMEQRNIVTQSGDTAMNTEEFLEMERDLKESYNELVRRVTYYIEELNLLNTAITNLTIFTSTLRKCPPSLIGHSAEYERCIHSLLIMLSIFAPHFASEAWSALASVPLITKSNLWKKHEPVWRQDWPKFDDDAALDLEIFLAGENRGRIPIERKLVTKLDVEEAFKIAQGSKVMVEAKKTFEAFIPVSISHIDNYGVRLYVQARQKRKQKKQ